MSMSKWRDAGEFARINSVPMGLEVLDDGLHVGVTKMSRRFNALRVALSRRINRHDCPRPSRRGVDAAREDMSTPSCTDTGGRHRSHRRPCPPLWCVQGRFCCKPDEGLRGHAGAAQGPSWDIRSPGWCHR